MNHAVDAAIDQLEGLTADELRQVNEVIVRRLKQDTLKRSLAVSAALKVGDIVTFDAKTRGIVVGEVIGFGTNGKNLKVRQTNGYRAGMVWNVTASLVKKA